MTYPSIDPVALQLGPIAIHWYGLMYLVGFGAGWWLGRLRAKSAGSAWSAAQVDDLVFYVAIGVVVGGRLGYALFYDFARVAAAPWSVFQVWEGGMSFHGGLVGVLVAALLFARKHGYRFFEVSDFVAPLVPIGLGCGRLGNFINGELWGKPSALPWAMVFPDPRAGEIARHPSQLYQALLEGAVLFVILWLFSRQSRPRMAISGLFLVGYGASRFAVEFVRVPDAHLGYLAWGWLTMGQVLTAPMAGLGFGLLWAAYARPVAEVT